MRVEYFEDTDTLQITFKEGNVVDSRDLDENTLIEVDAEGQLVTITIEHALRKILRTTEIPTGGNFSWKSG
jgi:uncharacterized protein YuzE